MALLLSPPVGLQLPRVALNQLLLPKSTARIFGLTVLGVFSFAQRPLRACVSNRKQRPSLLLVRPSAATQTVLNAPFRTASGLPRA